MKCTNRHEHARRFSYRTERDLVDDVPGIVNGARDIASRYRPLESCTSIDGLDVPARLDRRGQADRLVTPTPSRRDRRQIPSAPRAIAIPTRAGFIQYAIGRHSLPDPVSFTTRSAFIHHAARFIHHPIRFRSPPDRPSFTTRWIGDRHRMPLGSRLEAIAVPASRDRGSDRGRVGP